MYKRTTHNITSTLTLNKGAIRINKPKLKNLETYRCIFAKSALLHYIMHIDYISTCSTYTVVAFSIIIKG